MTFSCRRAPLGDALSWRRSLCCLCAGMTYERASIMKWVDVQKHDPCTKAPLRRRHLSPNLALRGVIENWLTAQCASRCVTVVPLPLAFLSSACCVDHFRRCSNMLVLRLVGGYLNCRTPSKAPYFHIERHGGACAGE
jgi:hypothetical protein